MESAYPHCCAISAMSAELFFSSAAACRNRTWRRKASGLIPVPRRKQRVKFRGASDNPDDCLCQIIRSASCSPVVDAVIYILLHSFVSVISIYPRINRDTLKEGGLCGFFRKWPKLNRNAPLASIGCSHDTFLTTVSLDDLRAHFEVNIIRQEV